MGWLCCVWGVASCFQINYLCMKFTAGVSAWIKLSDTLHLTTGRRESGHISEGRTSPGRLWVPDDGEQSTIGRRGKETFLYLQFWRVYQQNMMSRGTFRPLVFTVIPSHIYFFLYTLSSGSCKCSFSSFYNITWGPDVSLDFLVFQKKSPLPPLPPGGSPWILKKTNQC